MWVIYYLESTYTLRLRLKRSGARVRARRGACGKMVIDAAMAAPEWWWPEEQGALGDGRPIDLVDDYFWPPVSSYS